MRMDKAKAVCLRHEGGGNKQGKGSVFAVKAVETQGKECLRHEAVETQGKYSGQRQCLRHEGSGKTRQGQCLRHEAVENKTKAVSYPAPCVAVVADERAPQPAVRGVWVAPMQQVRVEEDDVAAEAQQQRQQQQQQHASAAAAGAVRGTRHAAAHSAQPQHSTAQLTKVRWRWKHPGGGCTERASGQRTRAGQ